MKKYKLSYLGKKELILKLRIKYTTINSLKVSNVEIYQHDTAKRGIITIVEFEFGFVTEDTTLEDFISFEYSNDELVDVTGDNVKMKFIDEMKSLLKEK